MSETPRTSMEHIRIRTDASIALNREFEHMTAFARQLEREIAELNERLIDRQNTLMAALTENQNLKIELAKQTQA